MSRITVTNLALAITCHFPKPFKAGTTQTHTRGVYFFLRSFFTFLNYKIFGASPSIHAMPVFMATTSGAPADFLRLLSRFETSTDFRKQYTCQDFHCAFFTSQSGVQSIYNLSSVFSSCSELSLIVATMTKLLQWLSAASIFFAIWISLVLELVPVNCAKIQEVLLPLPVYLLIVFGVRAPKIYFSACVSSGAGSRYYR